MFQSIEDLKCPLIFKDKFSAWKRNLPQSLSYNMRRLDFFRLFLLILGFLQFSHQLLGLTFFMQTLQ